MGSESNRITAKSGNAVFSKFADALTRAVTLIPSPGVSIPGEQCAGHDMKHSTAPHGAGLYGIGTAEKSPRRSYDPPSLANTCRSWLVARYWQPAFDNQGDKAPTSRIESLDKGPR